MAIFDGLKFNKILENKGTIKNPSINSGSYKIIVAHSLILWRCSLRLANFGKGDI